MSTIDRHHQPRPHRENNDVVNVSVASAATVANPKTAESVQAKIDSKIGELSGLTEDISSIMAEIQAHGENRPQAPGKDADEKAQDKFQKEMDAWQRQGEQLQRRLSSVQGKLQRTQTELNTLQNTDLPNAMRHDAEAVRNQASAEAQRAKQQNEVSKPQRTEEEKNEPTSAELDKAELAREDRKKSFQDFQNPQLADGVLVRGEPTSETTPSVWGASE